MFFKSLIPVHQFTNRDDAKSWDWNEWHNIREGVFVGECQKIGRSLVGVSPQ